ncbi:MULTISPECIES: MarR family transcriptional regulator [unclassified Lysinibacillus]|uniref:MarR family winged helix-turn-helix transcriptional regulator n=1 Tax=unclassified Lysinibacillus TaxID=2636778 RepID=UPI002010ED6A|nr:MULTISPECIES: MarR family transcriptional regulator [unclassified Lysinibacillus]MCL1696166.1 MarR family transcriptional regulator [Lysinibacillus sp. BPa_S21]MCL1700459.1 MarR family transcriptional regulator [Lysinibacillus sp. Bpr_S20]
MTEKIKQIVDDINQYTYEMNVKLAKAQEALFTDDLSMKQTLVIDFVHKHKKCTMGEIAHYMEISPSAVSQIVSRLEKENYLKRDINPNNRREVVVMLAENGDAYYHRDEQINELIIEKIYSKMPVEDLEQLRSLIQRLNRIVEEEISNGLE